MSSISAGTTSTTALISTADTTGSLVLKTGASATTAMTIDTSQNVGIGTSSPNGTLNVKAQAGQGVPLRIEATDAGGNPQTVFAGSRTYQIGTGNSGSGFAGQLFFYDGTAAATRMVLDSSGNVGIGTSSPLSTAMLEVSRSTTVIPTATVTADNQVVGWRARRTGGTYPYEYYMGIRENSTALDFYDNTANALRARIDSSGNLLVNTTNAGSQKFRVQAATDVVLGVASATGLPGALTLNATNDANNANVALDFRASAIYSSAGIGTTASAANAFFNNASNNQFLRSTSALKYKTNIRDIESIDVNKFRPVRYNSLCEADDPNKEHFGIIADEVDAAGIKELVTYGENGEVEGFQYERLTVVLLKAIQEQQQMIETLQAKVAALEVK